MTKEFDERNAAKSRAVCAAMEDVANSMRRRADLRHGCGKGAASDDVSHPAHYTNGGIECIDAMRAALTPDEFRGYLRGNVIKYVWRCELKGRPVEDLRKAAWYLDRLTDEMEVR